MSYFIFLTLGFSILWVGVKLFDDEVLLIVSLLVGSSFVLVGLISSPAQLQLVVEVILIVNVFHICVECIERGDRA